MRFTPHLLLLPMAIASVQIAYAQDTAYQALRTLGSARDQALLSRVIEVKGRNGASQPSSWLIVIDDPDARGGIREVEVSKGKIISERTPVQTYSGATSSTLDMARLNLDSEGAFTVAEDEARAAKVTFDSVDYVLRPDEGRGAPLWVLQLLDQNQRGVGTIRIAADNGNVLSRNFRSAPAAPPAPASTPRSSRNQVAERPPEPTRRPRDPQPTPQRARQPERTSAYLRDEEPPRTTTRTRTQQQPRTQQPRTRTTKTQGGQPVRQYETYEGDGPTLKEIGNDIGEVGKNVGQRINRRAHRIGGALQQFFTGKRTVDDKYREPYDRVPENQ